jgi:DNA polymerase III epsilon subunit-like protein
MSKFIIVYDFETGDVDPHTCHPLQIGAVAIERSTLEFVPPEEGGSFVSYMRPPISDDDIFNWDIIKQRALDKNKISRETIIEAPAEKVVWVNFIDWIKKFKSGRDQYTKPVRAGHNILKFDDIIVARLNEKYGQKPPFHPRDFVDTMNLSFLLFESNPEMTSYSFDALRPHLGFSADGAHEAMNDVVTTGKYLTRVMKYFRAHCKRQKYFQNSFNERSEATL